MMVFVTVFSPAAEAVPRRLNGKYGLRDIVGPLAGAMSWRLIGIAVDIFASGCVVTCA
jgi:hypothetical protein